jgi:hypothetical protein
VLVTDVHGTGRALADVLLVINNERGCKVVSGVSPKGTVQAKRHEVRHDFIRCSCLLKHAKRSTGMAKHATSIVNLHWCKISHDDI